MSKVQDVFPKSWFAKNKEVACPDGSHCDSVAATCLPGTAAEAPTVSSDTHLFDLEGCPQHVYINNALGDSQLRMTWVARPGKWGDVDIQLDQDAPTLVYTPDPARKQKRTAEGRALKKEPEAPEGDSIFFISEAPSGAMAVGEFKVAFAQSSAAYKQTRIEVLNNYGQEIWLAGEYKLNGVITAMQVSYTRSPSCQDAGDKGINWMNDGCMISFYPPPNGRDPNTPRPPTQSQQVKIFIRTGCVDGELEECADFPDKGTSTISCKRYTKNLATAGPCGGVYSPGCDSDTNSKSLDSFRDPAKEGPYQLTGCAIGDQCVQKGTGPVRYMACATGGADATWPRNKESNYKLAFSVVDGANNSPFPVTQFELTLNTEPDKDAKADSDWMNLSIVAGYNVPMARLSSPTDANQKCTVQGGGAPNMEGRCPLVNSTDCPPELRHYDATKSMGTLGVNGALTGACYDINKAVKAPNQVMLDLPMEPFGWDGTGTLIKYAETNQFGRRKGEKPDDPTPPGYYLSHPTTVSDIFPNIFGPNDTRLMVDLFGCSGADPSCVSTGPGDHKCDDWDDAAAGRGCPVEKMGFSCPPTQGIGCCAMESPAYTAASLDKTFGNCTAKCEATSDVNGKQGCAPPTGSYEPFKPRSPICPGCPYNIWPDASNGKTFTEWKYKAMASGCYGTQYGERVFPPFDKIAFKPVLAVCNAGMKHRITISNQP
ncbi:MAG: hypothetical protein J3K34DRAFT_413800 [Monoraphidium minutum]|nr:MAG: hypothetical protein J3K34DRAFT_413800 [Monoraphidium minutum]